jgi:hypothetical protein
MPEPRELDSAAAGLIRASLTGDKFATDRILTRAVETDLDGLFFAFAMANLAARVLAYACGSEAHAVALMDSLINGLVRERAQTAALLLKFGFVPGLCLLSGLGLGLRFQLHPRGVFAAGLSFGLLGRHALRGLVRLCYQLVEPRCLVILFGFTFRACPPLRLGSGRRVHIRDAP